VGLLNNYFDQMVKEIIAHGGHVDKFMGDAVMAVFRGEYHLDRGVDAALGVRALIAEIQSPLPDGTQYQPQVSIGINTGEMVSGNIGSASLKRLDYTVIGDAVNVSQRLQAAAQPGQIIVTDATYELLKESFECQPVGETTLKNKSKPVMMYEVVA
jgi:class 3 adenylate cyclase